MSTIGNAALVITLAVLIVYAYHTSLLAKEAWSPSASISIAPIQEQPYSFVFTVQNHRRIAVRCWCNLNAKVLGQEAQLPGFYGEHTSVDLQPYGSASGVLHINQLLQQVGKTIEDMKQLAATGEHNEKELLYMNISFSYEVCSTGEIVVNPNLPHYFDFNRSLLIFDF
jgi:hypothetical protein